MLGSQSRRITQVKTWVEELKDKLQASINDKNVNMKGEINNGRKCMLLNKKGNNLQII